MELDPTGFALPPQLFAICWPNTNHLFYGQLLQCLLSESRWRTTICSPIKVCSHYYELSWYSPWHSFKNFPNVAHFLTVCENLQGARVMEGNDRYHHLPKYWTFLLNHPVLCREMWSVNTVRYCGLNFGVCPAVFSQREAVNEKMFYFKWNEMYKLKNYIGVVIRLLSVVQNVLIIS